MKKNNILFCIVIAALLAGLFFVNSMGFAQGANDGPVKVMKTRSGSVTYIEVSSEYTIDIFSKTAGEPTDFAGVVQRCNAARRQVVFAMNGARCDKALMPVGLLIKGDTKQKDFAKNDKDAFGAPGPGSVFAIDRNNGVHIIPGKNFKASDDLATYKLAIQSGMMLLSKGFLNPTITRVVTAQVSSGIGVKANGDIVLAITDTKMSLHEFALFFQQLNCRDAMLLDDDANCQWYVPGSQKKTTKMGEILVVTKK